MEEYCKLYRLWIRRKYLVGSTRCWIWSQRKNNLVTFKIQCKEGSFVQSTRVTKKYHRQIFDDSVNNDGDAAGTVEALVVQQKYQAINQCTKCS